MFGCFESGAQLDTVKSKLIEGLVLLRSPKLSSSFCSAVVVDHRCSQCLHGMPMSYVHPLVSNLLRINVRESEAGASQVSFSRANKTSRHLTHLQPRKKTQHFLSTRTVSVTCLPRNSSVMLANAPYRALSLQKLKWSPAVLPSIPNSTSSNANLQNSPSPLERASFPTSNSPGILLYHEGTRVQSCRRCST